MMSEMFTPLDNVSDPITFNADGTAVITDNSANAHIFNDSLLFEGDIMPMNPTTGVATIRGTDDCPSGVGKVPLSWKD
eukprot:2716850-Ditylum_brightwellii.AAC.1